MEEQSVGLIRNVTYIPSTQRHLPNVDTMTEQHLRAGPMLDERFALAELYSIVCSMLFILFYKDRFTSHGNNDLE